MNDIAILATTRYVPETYSMTKEIYINVGIDEDKYKAINIQKVHIADNENAYDMALKCAKKLLEKSNIDKKNIRYIVYASAVNEYIIADYSMKLCRELGLWNAETVNINQFCNSAIVAIEYLYHQLKFLPQEHYGLMVTSECFHDIGINRWTAANTLYYGDGASAALLGKSRDSFAIRDSNDVTVGKYNEMWKMPIGGLKSKFSNVEAIKKAFNYEFGRSEENIVNPMVLFKLMGDSSKKVVFDMLSRNKLNIDDINHFVMYNSGEFMQNFLIKSLKVERNKVLTETAKEYGHIGSSDIIFNLDYLLEQDRVNVDDNIVLFSMESGLNFRCILLKRQG